MRCATIDLLAIERPIGAPRTLMFSDSTIRRSKGPEWQRALLVAGILCISLAGRGDAQITATLTAVGGAEFPGQIEPVRILASCSSPIDGISFGLSHDPGVLSISSTELGSAFATEPPDFVDISTDPVGGAGLTIGLIVNFPLAIRLAPGVDHEILVVHYQIAFATPHSTTTTITPVSSLGSPPVEALVVSGLVETAPTLTSGQLFFLGPDCNGNLVIDAEDVALGTSADCNLSGVPDECEIADGLETDCNADGIPDSCDPDCDVDGVSDVCQILGDPTIDCDGNGRLDTCDLVLGAPDCDGDGLLDSCEVDCDGNGIADPCELLSGNAFDCDGSGTLDSCEIASGALEDCDGNSIPDLCDLADGALDCDGNDLLDICEIAAGAGDCDANGLLDLCELDCDANGSADVCEILAGTADDCDTNGALDLCDLLIAENDQNSDGRLDVCELPFLRGDTNENGLINLADAYSLLVQLFVNPTTVRCLASADTNGDCALDLPDALFMLEFLFNGGPPLPAPFGACGIDSSGCALACTPLASCP